MPNPTVTRWRCIACRIASGLVSSGITTVPPMKRTGRTLTPVPPTRKNGVIATVTSSLCRSAQVSRLTTFHVTLAWVSMIALGEPVVPEVWGSRQTSSMSTDTSTGCSADSVTSVSKSNAAFAEPATVIRCRTASGVATGSASSPCWISTFGRRVVKDRANLTRREPVVHRSQGRADQPAGEQRLQERGVVRSQPRHPVAALYAEPQQTVGQAPNPTGQVRVRQRPTISHQRQTVWRHPSAALDPRADPKVGASAGAAGIVKAIRG